jgi:hypothetical protein
MAGERISLPGVPVGDRPGVATRVASAAALFGMVGAAAWVTLALVRLFTDAWIAPAHLSPDNDRVLQLQLQVTRALAEVDRAQAEVERIDESLSAIDVSIERLSHLGENSGRMFRWGADARGRTAEQVTRRLRVLRDERQVLQRLRDRQAAAVERARADLAGGMIGRDELENEVQALDHIELQLTRNARARLDSQAEADLARRERRTYAAELEGEVEPTEAQLPEIVRRHETMTRLELELVELEAERRGMVATRAIAERNLTRMREVLEQLQARPLWQATERDLDVAFVPYEQLEGVASGDRLLRCHVGIFACGDVGRVERILPGEVVTQDPWGELARGRYAVLELDDAEAVQERILRVRQR